MNNDRRIQRKDDSKQVGISIPSGGIEISHKGKPVVGSSLAGQVYLLIDCSSSMRDDKITQAKSGALNFAKNAMAKGYGTGLIQFDSSAKLLCEPYTDISTLERALAKIEIGDLTHMAKAIHLAHDLLKNLSCARVIVIVTDGVPNGEGDPVSTLRIADIVKKNGIDIIAIGTDDADKEFLRKIASRSELGIKTASIQLEKTISDSANMLPPGNRGITRA